MPPPQYEEAYVKKLKEWARARYSTSVLRSAAERVAAGLTTAAVVAILIDATNSGWALGALAFAGALIHLAARLPKGDQQ